MSNPVTRLTSKDGCSGLRTALRLADTAVHIVASKVAALVIHFGLLVPILRADHWV